VISFFNWVHPFFVCSSELWGVRRDILSYGADIARAREQLIPQAFFPFAADPFVDVLSAWQKKGEIAREKIARHAARGVPYQIVHVKQAEGCRVKAVQSGQLRQLKEQGQQEAER